MSEDTLMFGFIFLAGCFSMAASYYQWGWFMNNRRARLVVKFLGYQGARIFYGLLGGGLAVVGLLGFIAGF
ncbi:MAG: immunity 17 family protein [Deinococcota bacterium]